MTPPPNVHPNPLSGLSEDYDIPDDWQSDEPDPDEQDVAAELWAEELRNTI